jgi:hypothetical protein
MTTSMLLLGLITLLAATVNGALGYGFSSITVPLGVALGVPLGGQIIRRLRPETFRRICMSFDAWVVAFGLSRLQHDMHLVKSDAAYLLVLAVALLDAWLLFRFLRSCNRRSLPPPWPTEVGLVRADWVEARSDLNHGSVRRQLSRCLVECCRQ